LEILALIGIPVYDRITQRLLPLALFQKPCLQMQGRPLEPATVALRYRVTTLHSGSFLEQSQSARQTVGEGGG
jgi:hypothetical protein